MREGCGEGREGKGEAGVERKKKFLPGEACPNFVKHTSAAASSQLSPGCEKFRETVTQALCNHIFSQPSHLPLSLQAGAVLPVW